jgi:hypothetical protein
MGGLFSYKIAQDATNPQSCRIMSRNTELS